jgi:CubicO group peptidase (beta-lactamase class C family)
MLFRNNLEKIFNEAAAKARFSGAVLISQGNDPIYTAAFGYANRAWRINNQIETRFRIASISKMFTALGVLQLIEQGIVAFDTSIVVSLGLEDTTISPHASVYHMLTMTSGMADWFDESGDWEAKWDELIREHPIYLFRRNEDYLPLFENEPPLAAPGKKYQYNGAGYILLGMLIEKITGEPYFDWTADHVFSRAEMHQTGFVALDDVDENVAEGYIPIMAGDEGDIVSGWKRNIYSTTPAAAADGGATSTVKDLQRFSQSLRQGELLSESMTNKILTPQVVSMDEPFRGYVWKYGFGNMFILDHHGSIVRWGHTGEEDGVSCRLYYYPEQDLDVVILGNQSWSTLKLAWEVHDLIVG